MNLNLNMDSFVSKLRNTVSNVAYQVNTSVNTIIPGNPIHRDYETLKLRCTHGSPGFVWSVYDAIKRDSASIKASLKDAIGPSLSTNGTHIQDQTNDNTDEKKLYSVFAFDKSQLDSLSRAEKEVALEHIKRGVTQLTRLRHPSILVVHHALEESRSSLAFVAEHVYGHLESILKEQRLRRIETRNVRNTSDLVDLNQDLGPKDTDYQKDSCQLDNVQVKAGLLQLCDGLKFLHNDAKMLHRNLCLDNIFVDSNNTWKIAGFDFSCQSSGTQSNSDDTGSMNIVDINMTRQVNQPIFPSLKTIHSSLPPSIVPNWSCSAPEHSNSDQVTLASDVFSLGILSCALLGNDMDMIDLSYEYGLISDTYKRGIKIRELADRLPANVKTSVMKFAAINVDSRPSLDDYQSLPIFHDQQVQAIRDLDSQFAWDRLKKIDFFNRLRDVLPQLSHQVKVNRIARSLFNEVLNPDMVPYVLPNILIIAKDSTPSEFKSRIFPNLKGPFRILEPKAVPLMLLDNLSVLADRAKLCLPDFQKSAFTLIQYLLKTDQQMQEKCLSVLPTVKKYLDNTSLNQQLLPEINRVYRETNVLAIRVKCTQCIGEMVDRIERATIINGVLPIVLDLPSKECEVIMSAVTVIKNIVNNQQTNLSKDVVAGRLLPFLTPLIIEKDLGLTEFNAIMTLIRNLLARVENEQKDLLAKKSGKTIPATNSGPLVLDNFKGSNHFLVD